MNYGSSGAGSRIFKRLQPTPPPNIRKIDADQLSRRVAGMKPPLAAARQPSIIAGSDAPGNSAMASAAFDQEPCKACSGILAGDAPTL